MNREIKNASEKELLTEISKRVNEGKIDWKISFFYDTDVAEMKFTCQNENDWALTFAQPVQIEKGYLCRTAFKKFEPILQKAEQRRKDAEKPKPDYRIIFELLRNRFKKNN